MEEKNLDQIAEQQLEAAAPEVQEIDPAQEKIQNNLAAMRRKLEEAQQREREALARAQELERRYPAQQPQKQEQIPTEDEEFGDPEEYVQASRLQKTTKKLTSKMSESQKKMQELEERLSRYEAERELDRISDWKAVVTEENVKTFAQLYPDDYATVSMNPNLKGKAKTLYNMIKNYGIASAAPVLKQTQNVRSAESRIESNLKKPQAAVSMAATPSPLKNLARYNEEGRLVMSEEDAARINAETMRKIRGY